ncbi:hypothetical protein Taro_002945 [Colocasia esculenta]|uniref:FACT complex subunit SSRP1 n=1 Tax=Colocasia esculenta TaxID=4460 RepID=A0A843TMV0_COLES|nr:hypothetical protein [Colocasia esculenta]
MPSQTQVGAWRKAELGSFVRLRKTSTPAVAIIIVVDRMDILLNIGLIHEVFTLILRGLSGAKVTRPGKFRSCQDGYAVKSSLKAEDGLLYPLEKGFFFLPKPPTLILHDEIDYVEFERHGAGSSNAHYFDLLVKLKSEQEHLFRNIQRNEYSNLFNFISGKGLKIMNLGEGQTANGVARAIEDDDDAKPPKRDVSKEASTTKPAKRKGKDGDEEGKKRKPKKKKDPNAPKRAMSDFMFFSNAERENVRKNNPGMSFTEVGKTLGEMWKKMSAEEKEPYKTLSRADQERYKEAMAGYKSGGGGGPVNKMNLDVVI